MTPYRVHPELTPNVIRCLEEAGWRPGRMVETRPWESRLARANIAVPSLVREFLQEFGGLRIEFANVTSRRPNAYLRISPAAAREVIDVRLGMDMQNVQAERDMTTLVKRNAELSVGKDFVRRVVENETKVIGAHQSTTVGAEISPEWGKTLERMFQSVKINRPALA